MLGKRFKIEQANYFRSAPGGQQQQWHADGLFSIILSFAQEVVLPVALPLEDGGAQQ